MGNQQGGGPAGPGRFTLRGLSWRAPRFTTQLPGSPQTPRALESEYEVEPEPWDARESTASAWARSVVSEGSSAPQSSRQRPAQESLRATESAASIASKGPEFQNLYNRLTAFYTKHDPKSIANDEIDISGMASWCLEEEDGSIEVLNEKLFEKFGADLNQGNVQRTPSSIQDQDEYDSGDEEDQDDARDSTYFVQESKDDQDEVQVRDKLERFLLQVSPGDLPRLQEYLDEFHSGGLQGLDAMLRNEFGKDLDSIGSSKPGSAAAVPAPAVSRATRKVSKVGVQLGSDDLFSEMKTGAGLRNTTTQPPRSPKKKRETIDDASNISSSLQRKWNHLKNRDLGLSARISTHITSRFASKPVTREARAPSTVEELAAQQTPTPFTGTASSVSTGINYIPKPRGMRGSVKEIRVEQGKAPVNLRTGQSAVVIPKTSAADDKRAKQTAYVETKTRNATTVRPNKKNACGKFVLNLEGDFGTCSTCGCKRTDHNGPKKQKIAATLARKWGKISA